MSPAIRKTQPVGPRVVPRQHSFGPVTSDTTFLLLMAGGAFVFVSTSLQGMGVGKTEFMDPWFDVVSGVALKAGGGSVAFRAALIVDARLEPVSMLPASKMIKGDQILFRSMAHATISIVIGGIVALAALKLGGDPGWSLREIAMTFPAVHSRFDMIQVGKQKCMRSLRHPLTCGVDIRMTHCAFILVIDIMAITANIHAGAMCIERADRGLDSVMTSFTIDVVFQVQVMRHDDAIKVLGHQW